MSREDKRIFDKFITRRRPWHGRRKPLDSTYPEAEPRDVSYLLSDEVQAFSLGRAKGVRDDVDLPDKESAPLNDVAYCKAGDLLKRAPDECYEVNIPGALWSELCTCHRGRKRAAVSDGVLVGQRPSRIRLAHPNLRENSNMGHSSSTKHIPVVGTDDDRPQVRRDSWNNDWNEMAQDDYEPVDPENSEDFTPVQPHTQNTWPNLTLRLVHPHTAVKPPRKGSLYDVKRRIKHTATELANTLEKMMDHGAVFSPMNAVTIPNSMGRVKSLQKKGEKKW